MSVLLVLLTVGPAFSQDRPDDSDIENIGNRDINDGFFTNWNFILIQEKIALRKELSKMLERQVQLVSDSGISEYVNRVGQNLARNSDAQVPFTFKVIDDDIINAYALPGGFIYINSVVLLSADNEAELAGMMVHEITHVTARHGTESATKNQIINLASLPLIFVDGVAGIAARQAASIGIPLSYLSFSRGAEEESDYLGSQYAYKTRDDPVAAVTFFEKLQAIELSAPGAMSPLFETHPQTSSRIEKIQQKIDLILPGLDRYVLTTSEFNDVHREMIAYYDSRPSEVDYPSRPSLRRRTPSTDTASQPAPREDDIDTDDPNRLPEGDDRPVLRRRPLV